MKRLCRNPPRDFFHRSCTATSPKTCLQRSCKKLSKKSLAEIFCIEILQKHVSEILSLFRPSESATTVHTGHGTKRASYNENCSRQSCTNCLSKGNHVTEWRTWRNQNGSAKVVSQSLRNISSHLCSERPRMLKGIELFCFGPTVTKFPKYSNSKQLCVLQCETVVWMPNQTICKLERRPTPTSFFRSFCSWCPANHCNPQSPNQWLHDAFGIVQHYSSEFAMCPKAMTSNQVAQPEPSWNRKNSIAISRKHAALSTHAYNIL